MYGLGRLWQFKFITPFKKMFSNYCCEKIYSITINPYFILFHFHFNSWSNLLTHGGKIWYNSKCKIKFKKKLEGVDRMFDEFDASEWWEFSHQGRGDNGTLFGMRGMILGKQWYASVNTTQSKTKWSSTQTGPRVFRPWVNNPAACFCHNKGVITTMNINPLPHPHTHTHMCGCVCIFIICWFFFCWRNSINRISNI